MRFKSRPAPKGYTPSSSSSSDAYPPSYRGIVEEEEEVSPERQSPIGDVERERLADEFASVVETNDCDRLREFLSRASSANGPAVVCSLIMATGFRSSPYTVPQVGTGFSDDRDYSCSCLHVVVMNNNPSMGNLLWEYLLSCAGLGYEDDGRRQLFELCEEKDEHFQDSDLDVTDTSEEALRQWFRSHFVVPSSTSLTRPSNAKRHRHCDRIGASTAAASVPANPFLRPPEPPAVPPPPLHLLALQSNAYEALEWLLNGIAPIRGVTTGVCDDDAIVDLPVDSDGRRLLHYAVGLWPNGEARQPSGRGGDALPPFVFIRSPFITSLIRHGADVNAPDKHGRTPLAYLFGRFVELGGAEEGNGTAVGERLRRQSLDEPLFLPTYCAILSRAPRLIMVLLEHGGSTLPTTTTEEAEEEDVMLMDRGVAAGDLTARPKAPLSHRREARCDSDRARFLSWDTTVEREVAYALAAFEKNPSSGWGFGYSSVIPQQLANGTQADMPEGIGPTLTRRLAMLHAEHFKTDTAVALTKPSSSHVNTAATAQLRGRHSSSDAHRHATNRLYTPPVNHRSAARAQMQGALDRFASLAMQRGIPVTAAHRGGRGGGTIVAVPPPPPLPTFPTVLTAPGGDRSQQAHATLPVASLGTLVTAVRSAEGDEGNTTPRAQAILPTVNSVTPKSSTSSSKGKRRANDDNSPPTTASSSKPSSPATGERRSDKEQRRKERAKAQRKGERMQSRRKGTPTTSTPTTSPHTSSESRDASDVSPATCDTPKRTTPLPGSIATHPPSPTTTISTFAAATSSQDSSTELSGDASIALSSSSARITSSSEGVGGTGRSVSLTP